jgi:uncharacterized protein YlxW (UPF0749 family)
MPDTDGLSGRQRLLRALLRPSRGQVVVAVLLSVLAFAAVTQVRATHVDEAEFAGYREQDLIDVLSALAGTSERAEAEIQRLERTRDDLLSDSDSRKAALKQAREEADALAILAGLVEVHGPGLRIVIEEETDTVSAQTLLDMVQELRTAGAEAIQVDGRVRLVAQSAFAPLAPGRSGVVIDGQELEPPYVFDVIGDPHNLEGALSFPNGPQDQVGDEGGTMEVQEFTSLEITAVREPTDPEYAAPATGQ